MAGSWFWAESCFWLNHVGPRQIETGVYTAGAAFSSQRSAVSAQQSALRDSVALSLAARIAGSVAFAGFISAFLLRFFARGVPSFGPETKPSSRARILLRLRAFNIFRRFHCSY